MPGLLVDRACLGQSRLPATLDTTMIRTLFTEELRLPSLLAAAFLAIGYLLVVCRAWHGARPTVQADGLGGPAA
jgi:hypothetical protein